jgi:glycosyltransferase involved in cell wall biosynthesis
MNVTIIIDELDMGGAQHIVYEIARNIDKSKYKITIICTDGKVNSILERQMMEEQKNGDYSLVFLKKPLFMYINTPSKELNRILRRLLRAPSDLLAIPSICRETRKTKPDIVHAHQRGILAGCWTLFHGIPMIATVHTNPKATFYRECEKIIFIILVLCKRIILVGISKFNSELIKKIWHLNSAYIRYVNNGINIENFYQKPHETFTFINSSRQDKNKNQSLILRAFARLRHENPACPIKLFLVGDGNTHTKLKKEVQKLGINELVEFIGYVKSAKEYLALSDVYVSSSHREGLPLSVLEAMASGLPVIATNVGGLRDIVQDNGILVADDDEDGMFAAMKKLRDNDELRRLMGRKSLEMVQAYSASEMAAKYAALYDEFALKQS